MGRRAPRPATLPHFERDPDLMTPTRPTARGLLLLLAAFLLSAGAVRVTVGGRAEAHLPRSRRGPLPGRLRRSARPGRPRGERHHGAAARLRSPPRRAVKFWTTSARAGCMLYLYGASGTTYLYIHLNNDLGDTNDNAGGCVPGVAFARTEERRQGRRRPADRLRRRLGRRGRHPPAPALRNAPRATGRR